MIKVVRLCMLLVAIVVVAVFTEGSELERVFIPKPKPKPIPIPITT